MTSMLDLNQIPFQRERTTRRRSGSVQSEITVLRKQVRALVRQVQTTRDDERGRLARELHDELGQSLTALKLDLARFKIGLENKRRPLNREVSEMLASVDGLVDSVRSLAGELRPRILDDFGLIAAVEWQIARFQKKSELKCTFSLPEQEPELNPDQATALFRILQEALTNVVRHAEATQFAVNMHYDDAWVNLEIFDNGRGVDQEVASHILRRGLIGMQERAAALGGEAIIEPRQRGGTRVSVRIPIQSGETWPSADRRRASDRRKPIHDNLFSS
jgi:signal transduction histidine kinase